jgi:hypothetical protein
VLAARVAERRAEFLETQRAGLWERAARWIDDVQTRLRREVERSIVVDGLPVTEGIVRAVREMLIEEAVPHLELNISDDEKRAAGYRQEIDKALGQEPSRRFGGRRLYRPDNVQVRDALERATEAAFGRALDGEVRKLAVRLLNDLAYNLMEPLREALHQGLSALRRDSASTDGRTSAVGQWPQGPAFPVPASLYPTATQFLIDPVERFPDTMRTMLAATVLQQSRSGDVVLLASDEVMRASGLPDSPPPLFDQTATWQPEAVREWSRNQVERVAGFQLKVTAADLLQRATAWVGDPSHRIGAYIGQSLADALGGASVNDEQRERLLRFRNAFAEAVRASAPLVDLDTAYESLQGGEGAGEHPPMITPIPLAEGTVAYEQTLDMLVEHARFEPDDAKRRFDPAGTGDIELTTFLGRPCHPVAFASLTRPILEDWRAKRIDSGRRASFQRWRRARPLPRAVPLPPPARRAMVRGWFVAWLAKEVTIGDGSEPVTLTRPDSQPLRFPYPLLGAVPHQEDPFDSLAAVLESLPLALVQPVHEDAVLLAYRRLLSLGHAVVPAYDATGSLQELRQVAHVRLPLAGPVPSKPERAWELREDIHAALNGLNSGWLR